MKPIEKLIAVVVEWFEGHSQEYWDYKENGNGDEQA